MKVITYATDPEHPRLRRFLAPSCAHHGLHLVVLPEASRIGRMGSNRNKDVWLADFLRRLPEDEIILSTDGYDTFFLAGEEEILSKYRAFGLPIVFSAERVCWPDPRLAERYPPSPTSARYLNAGGFLGPAGAILGALSGVRRQLAAFRFRRSNQYPWTTWFLRHRDRSALDHASRIFYCAVIPTPALRLERWPSIDAAFADGDFRREQVARVAADAAIESGRLRCLETGERPCHVHFNGLVQRIMDEPFFEPLCPWRPR